MTLTREHRRRRLAWARRIQPWQPRNWRRVLFSHESRFQLNKSDGRVRVYRRQHPRQTRNAFSQALQEEWRRIPDHVIRRIVHSARRRVAACIAARGGHTRY